MELEIKEADIYMIESGDILVFKIKSELSQSQNEMIIEAFYPPYPPGFCNLDQD